MKIYTCIVTHAWDNTMEPMAASFSTRAKAELFALNIREISNEYVTTIDCGEMDSDIYIDILKEGEW